MNAHILKKIKKMNKRGGIEGLPLELMLIVLIAGIGSAVLVGWMGNIEEPNSLGDIECSLSQINAVNDVTRGVTFCVTVHDSHGNPVPDAIVTLSGCGVYERNPNITPSAKTDGLGEASFTGLNVMKTGKGVGYITATVSSPELGEGTLKIPVVR